MFEVAEIGHKLSKKQFDELTPQLHTRLLEAQFKLQKTRHSIVIIISGVEGAGKGEVVNRLNEWLDSRGIATNAFWDETNDQTLRPDYWRFWRALPARGNIGILFGSWYTRPIVKKVFGEIDAAEFERQLKNICEFERMLADDGVIIIKLWFHMSKEAAVKRLAKEATLRKAAPETQKYLEQYDAFLPVCEQALRETEQSSSPWHIIEATNKKYRDATAAEIILNTFLQHLDAEQQHQESQHKETHFLPTQPTVLDHVNLDLSLTKKAYSTALNLAQNKLNTLSWEARKQRKSIVAVFEGWDASGKGSAIRRVTQAIDARLYKVISTAAPTDEEAAQHYLWRFWRHIPLAGYVTIYDRSWYGRVLVERVEKFAKDREWHRAYAEINHFEEQLYEHGIILCKFWIHISPEEQLRRFEERAKVPWKKHKITQEDWRNREKWHDYKTAIDDMVVHTSTQHAPWTLVPGNDKKYARINILNTLNQAIEKSLDSSSN
ncbi:MAG: polyphosphate:AMP phosphotransferase [SAR86 cluster bacterium]|uniref:Polyphosphate:AMP phosphotransferase n=1 Tax=SAR86 cluster bacterium TaxID=2030880 RepID=A0A2A5CDI8_9GAMM|nr:polyphosphate:AMP phosphotransferase [Gammaproteobacteria bacterium AH-315-E17]PCJ41530.1 MAG: polyphosphate:AMP phosphotransferase [SAR86 cluster bacterium]